MKSLYAKSPADLEKILKLEKSYQAKQIYSWLIKGVTDSVKNTVTEMKKKTTNYLKEKFSSQYEYGLKLKQAVKDKIKLYEEAKAKYTVEDSNVQAYTPPNKDGTVNYTVLELV